MAITECPQGHLYDPAIYPSCPYCGGNNTMIDFSQGSGGGTMAPAGYGAAPSPAPGGTVAPGAYGGYGSGTAAPAGYGAASSPAPNRTVPMRSGGSEGGKTVAPEGYRKRQEEENKTVATFKKRYDLEPVVGWLACVAGPDRGSSYQLLAKINTIGRSSENDVCIKGDATISRRSHARVAYDARHNNFRVIPDESTNNVYLNDEPIYTPSLLAAYDRIELGQSALIFVPLCCDRFRWEAEL